MPVNLGFAHASNAFLIAALLIYSLAVLAFAGDYAFGRPRRAASATGVRAAARAGARLATVGAGQAPAGLDAQPGSTPAGRTPTARRPAVRPARATADPAS